MKRVSRSIRARSRALRSIAPDVGSECSSSDENDVSLAQGRVVRTSLGCRYNFFYLLKWTLAAHGGFFREEYTIVVEARSILYAVRCAESNYPPGRLLILSDNLALVLLLCKGRSKLFTLLLVMRRIFTSGFREGFVLSFR